MQHIKRSALRPCARAAFVYLDTLLFSLSKLSLASTPEHSTWPHYLLCPTPLGPVKQNFKKISRFQDLAQESLGWLLSTAAAASYRPPAKPRCDGNHSGDVALPAPPSYLPAPPAIASFGDNVAMSAETQNRPRGVISESARLVRCLY